MNQLQKNSLQWIQNMSLEEQSNSSLLCPHHGETIEILIIDEKMKPSQIRSVCEKCLNNQSYRLISLTQAKNDHLSSFQKVYSETKNKLRTVENIDSQLNFIEKNHNNIVNSLEIITKVFSQIINNYKKEKYRINREMQFNSLTELEIFAEYIAQSKFSDEQQRICENYLNKFQKNIEEELKKELKQLNIHIQSVLHIVYSFDRKMNKIVTLGSEESIKTVDNLEQTALNNLNYPNDENFINLKCKEHNLELFLNMDASISDDTKRVSCINCSDGLSKQFLKLEEALLLHQKKFTEVSETILFQENAFVQMIQKNLRTIIYGQEQFCDFLKDIEIQFDSVLHHLKLRVKKKETEIFKVVDLITMINFAKEHFEIFYSKEYELADQFNQEILSKHNSEIESLFNQLFKQFSRIFDVMQKEQNQMQDLMRFKLNFLQINKALVGQFRNVENQYMQFNLDDRQLNFLQNNENLVQYSLKVEKSLQKFTQAKPQQQIAKKYYKDFLISQDSSWFVTVSYIQKAIDEIEFWLFNGKSYEALDKIEVQPIESLEIDSIHDACLSFNKNRFMVWRKNSNFKSPETIYLQNFIKATFNQNYTLLVVQQFLNGILDIFQYNSDLKIYEKSEVRLASIQEDMQFTVWFLQKPHQLPRQYLITFQEGRLLFHKIDLIKNQLNVIQSVNLETSEIIFCQNQNIFAQLRKYESFVSLYVIKQSEKNAEKFTISKFSMVYEFGLCRQVQFSQRGKFISIITGNSQIHIYCVERLPRLLEICQRFE